MAVKLSLEDEAWIVAITERVVLELKWSRHYAEYEARRLVVSFYEKQKCKSELRRKRPIYENQTAQQRADYDAWNAEYNRKVERRELMHGVLKCQFDAVGGSRRWVVLRRRQGRSRQFLSDMLYLTVPRIGQMEHEQKSAELNWLFKHNSQSRPIDMGGPRDVWLTYYSPPDPRLDNMEPVL